MFTIPNKQTKQTRKRVNKSLKRQKNRHYSVYRTASKQIENGPRGGGRKGSGFCPDKRISRKIQSFAGGLILIIVFDFLAQQMFFFPAGSHATRSSHGAPFRLTQEVRILSLLQFLIVPKCFSSILVHMTSFHNFHPTLLVTLS